MGRSACDAILGFLSCDVRGSRSGGSPISDVRLQVAPLYVLHSGLAEACFGRVRTASEAGGTEPVDSLPPGLAMLERNLTADDRAPREPSPDRYQPNISAWGDQLHGASL